MIIKEEQIKTKHADTTEKRPIPSSGVKWAENDDNDDDDADTRHREGKAKDLDDVLVNELGQFGRFQLFNILLVAAPMIMSPWMNDYIFTAATIPHRCRIPECDSATSVTYEPEWVHNAIPRLIHGISGCYRYAPVKGFNTNTTLDNCPVNAFDRSRKIRCDNIIYARNNSVVSEFNLSCKGWFPTLAGTMNSIGTLIALPISGFISDKFGRRMALVICLFNVGVIGFIRALSVDYPMYLSLQLLQTTLGSGLFSTAYIFATELVGPKHRMKVGASCSAMFALGQVSLGGIAWLVPNWRTLTFVLFIPSLFFISYYWILSESVRWLLSTKKYDEAEKVLQKVALVNRKQISEDSLKALTKQVSPVLEKSRSPNLFSIIYKSPILLRRVCITPIWWITTTFIYYGLAINSTSLSDTMHLNYMLTGAIELPGFLTAVFLVDKLGRKPTLSGGYFLCATCNIAFAFINREYTVTRLLLYLLGKYGIAVVFTSLYLYTSELYPTQYRHSLLAFSSMVGRIGSIVAQLTPALMQFWQGTPSMLFGFLGLLSGLLILTQPETLGSKLPDTLAEAEVLGQSRQSEQPDHKIKPLINLAA